MKSGSNIILVALAIAASVIAVWMLGSRDGVEPSGEPVAIEESPLTPSTADAAVGEEPIDEPGNRPERRLVPDADRGAAGPAEDGAAWVFRTFAADGSPIPGIPLAIWQGRDAYARAPIWTMHTDVLGVARVTKLRKRMRPIAEIGSTFVVVARVPTTRPVAVRFDGEVPPASPIDLVLPALASVDLELVDRNGTPVPLAVDFWVGARHAEPGDLFGGVLPEWGDRKQARREAGAGPVRFDHVAVGGEIGLSYSLAAGSGPGEPSRDHVSAPWRPGPARAARVELIQERLDDRFAILSGRLIDERGEPIASKPIGINPSVVWVPPRKLETDDDGRFALLLHRHLHEDPFALVLRPANTGLETRLMIRVRAWGEVFDLGDLVVGRGDVALAGRVVDENGTPIPGQTVMLEALAESGDPTDGPWTTSPALPVRTDEQGRFELRTVAPHGTVRARVPWLGARRAESPPCPLGTTGVEVRVLGPEVGNVVATFRTREGTTLDGLAAWLIPMGDDGRGRKAVAMGNTPPRAWFPAVDPGRYRLVVAWNDPHHEPLVIVEDVVVRAGETTDDSRLRDIELDAGIHSFHLELVAADGSPLPTRSGICYLEVPGEDDVRGFGFVGRTVEFAAPVPRVTVEILRSDRRVRRLEVRSGRSAVTLEEAPVIRVSLTELRRLVGEGVPIRIVVRPEGVIPSERTRIHGRGFSIRNLSTSAFLSDDGEVDLTVAHPGRHRLAVQNIIGDSPIGEIDFDLDTRTVRSITLVDEWRERAARLRPPERR